MLTSIISALGGTIIDSLLGKITGVFQAYFNKQITEAQLREQIQAAMLSTFAEVETAHADLTAKTYESFQQTLRTSPTMQRAWCWVVYSQLAVLLWHQAGIPLFVKVTGQGYPSSGSTVEWAYALLGFMFGAGAMMLRTGPGSSGGLLDALKRTVGK